MLELLRPLLASLIGEPTPRSPEEQGRVDAETAGWALYHYDSCYYCMRVRRAVRRLGLGIELRNVLRDPEHRRALVAGGGRSTVPCLRIPEGGGEDRWLYESADIVTFLDARFSP